MWPAKILFLERYSCLTVNQQLPVELIRAGLGEASAALFLKVQGSQGGQSQVSESEGEVIEIVTLAQELGKRNINQVDLWKLDVEGYELKALAGAQELLATHRIRALLVELAFDNVPVTREYLARFEYKCCFFDNRSRLYEPDILPEHTNGLFLVS